MDFTLSAGSVIDGRFEIISVAGTGGMGTVFRAKHLELGRIVALKTLDPMMVSDPELFERFKREARVLSELKHPHISMFYSFGVLETKLPYIAMEYLEGQSLSSVINEGAITAQRTIRIAMQICAAMSHAHKEGVIHRDLKPQNVFLLSAPEPDYVKLLDFGLAKYESQREQVLTKTGELIGTPEFLSPEQCLGRKADERSDIYSLSCILFRMLTGSSPFESDTPVGFLAKHLNERPCNPQTRITNTLPVGLDLVVLKGLEKDPHLRQQSMQELSDQLKMVLENKGAHLNINISESSKSAGRSLSTKLLVAIALLALIGSAIFVCKVMQDRASINKPKSIDALISDLEIAEKTNDKQTKLKSFTALESSLKLQASDPVNRAELFANTAQKLLELNLKDPAIQLAGLAFNEISSVRSNYSRAGYTTLGPATPLVGRFMDQNKVDKNKLYEDRFATDEKREELVTALGKITESAAAVLVKAGYSANKKVRQQCCQQLEHLRTVNINFENTGQLIIDAYEHGQMPINTCVITAYKDLNIWLLRKGDRTAFNKSLKVTEALLKKHYGENSTQLPKAYLDLVTDPGSTPKENHMDAYKRAVELIESKKYGKENFDASRLYLRAGDAADKLGINPDRYRFFKLAYETLQDEHDSIERAQILKRLAEDRLSQNQITEALKLSKKGLEQVSGYPDPNFTSADLTLTQARALVRMKAIDKACNLIKKEWDWLKQQLPNSSTRLAIMLQGFTQELRADPQLFGESQLAHNCTIASTEQFKAWHHSQDRTQCLGTNILTLMDIDRAFKRDPTNDWKVMTSLPDDAWIYALKFDGSTLTPSNFATYLKQENFSKIGNQCAERIENLAKLYIETTQADTNFVVNTVRTLQVLNVQKAESIKAIALEKASKSDRTILLKEFSRGSTE